MNYSCKKQGHMLLLLSSASSAVKYHLSEAEPCQLARGVTAVSTVNVGFPLPFLAPFIPIPTILAYCEEAYKADTGRDLSLVCRFESGGFNGSCLGCAYFSSMAMQELVMLSFCNQRRRFRTLSTLISRESATWSRWETSTMLSTTSTSPLTPPLSSRSTLVEMVISPVNRPPTLQ